MNYESSQVNCCNLLCQRILLYLICGCYVEKETLVEFQHNLWREVKQYNIMTDDSPSRNKCNTPSFPTISEYDGLEQNTYGHNTLVTTLIVSALLLS